MKILYIINSLGTGGAEKLVSDMIPLIKQKGIDIELLLLQKAKSLFIHKLEESGIKIYYSPNSIYSPKNIFFIKRFVKNYDLIHVHLFPAQYWAAFTFSKIPMVVTEHCTTNKRRKRKLYKWIERLTYGQYKKIISISDKANDAIQSWLGFHENKFIVIENGINLEAFYQAQSKKIENIPDNIKKIIMVGRFNATKDHPTAIKAMKLLGNNIHLLLVGDGILKVDCEKLANDLNVENRVHFMGLRNDIPELLKSCDINLISSHSEGLSISSLESLASGKPLVTSNVNGLKEINKDVGLMFEDNNSQELADCINQLLGDSLFYQKIAKRCLDKAKNYDIKKTVNQHILVYQQILKNTK